MRRVKAKVKCQNPLFVAWLEEWKADAVSRGTEMQFCFGKALNSLKRCPLPLKSGRDCMLLENFGPKLCAMIDKKLAQHLDSLDGQAAWDLQQFIGQPNMLIDVEAQNQADKSPQEGKRSKKTAIKEQPVKKMKTLDNKGEGETERDNRPKARANANANNASQSGSYVPAWRSGGYAILLTLYEKSLEPDYVGHMGKVDLQADAQQYCDQSLKKPTPGNRYTAWSSMSTLIEKGLVMKKSSPAKYSLTDAGLAVAMQLSEVDENSIAALGVSGGPGPSTSSGISRPKTSSSNGYTNGSSHIHSISSSDEDDPEPFPGISNNVYGEKQASVTSAASITSFTSVGSVASTASRQENGIARLQALNPIFRTDSQISSNSGKEINVVFRPNSFDVIMIIDDRETAGGKTRPKDDATIAELTRANVRFEVRNLKIGDFTWIAKCRTSGEELILPYIVERKRIDDFGGSIKDGRYHEQKFRLKKSGIQNITYLVENYGNNQFSGLPLTTIFQAATNTLVQDGFVLKYTKSHKDSMFYLASLTMMLTKIYQDKTLVGARKDDLMPASTENDMVQLMVFKDFNKAATKMKNFRIKEMFVKQLIQLNGMSVEKAVAIVDFYPTPNILKRAYDEAGSSGENLLASIQYGVAKRQLGPAISKTLHQYYTRKDF